MAKKVSLKGKKSYATYKALNSFSKNKIAKIQRHLKSFPDDSNASEALVIAKKGSFPTRKTPNARMGWIDKNKDVRFIGKTKAQAKKLAAIVKNEKIVINELMYDKNSLTSKNKVTKK